MNDADDLSEALRRYDEVVGEYVQVHQQIHDGLPPARRKPRWWLPLAVLSVLVLTLPIAYVGRAHFLPPPLVGTDWPNASNTGVPAGTTLTTFDTSGTNCNITTDNTVLNAKLIDCASSSVGALVIRAANVQITNSKIIGVLVMQTDEAGASGHSFTMDHSEVDGGNVRQWTVGLGNYVITNSNIYGGITAVQCDAGRASVGGDDTPSCIVRDSYLHDPVALSGTDHLGGFLYLGGGSTGTSIELTHNYVNCNTPLFPPEGGCTGDINLLDNFGTIHDVTITNNKMGANQALSYCTYGGSAFGGSSNIKYHDNVFERGVSGLCGFYGPWTNYDYTASGNEWDNNRYEDGVLIPIP